MMAALWKAFHNGHDLTFVTAIHFAVKQTFGSQEWALLDEGIITTCGSELSDATAQAHRITSLARTRIDSGIAIPSVLAVLQ